MIRILAAMLIGVAFVAALRGGGDWDDSQVIRTLVTVLIGACFVAALATVIFAGGL
jgi:formate/nitrite transporter FocA (FNT family)